MSLIKRAIRRILRLFRKDDRIYVKPGFRGILRDRSVGVPDSVGSRKPETPKPVSGCDGDGASGCDVEKEELLALAMEVQSIMEKSMPRAMAEKFVQEQLRSKIQADAAETARSIRG